MERSQHLFGRRHSQGRRCTKGRRFHAAGLGLLLVLSLIQVQPGRAEDVAARAGGLAGIAPVIEGEILAGRTPGVVVAVGARGGTAYRAAFGLKSVEPERTPLSADDIFDLASLTKVVATTTAVMQLVEAGRLDLDRPVAVYWPAFAANGKGQITLRQLLTHTSGLPADLDLSTPWGGQEEGLTRVAGIRPVRSPGRFLYSDVNFIVLGELVRRVSGERLDLYAKTHIFEPLRMMDTGFTPSPIQRDRIVATDRENGLLRWGEVQDPTAFRMEGVAGHAGLFSTAADLSRFAQMLLQGGSLDGVRILKPETVALMTQPSVVAGGARRGLGWDVSSAYSAGMDVAFGPTSYGHTGYTGCSLWLDPATQSYLIVLTSRLHPDGRGDVKPLRRELARVTAEWVR